MKTQIPFYNSGPKPYLEVLELQLRAHKEVCEGRWPGALLAVEHEPCLTMGKHALKDYLLSNGEQLAAQGISLVKSDRGGEITAHNPGQVVIYPVLKVSEQGLGPRDYVCILETAVRKWLQSLGISAHLDKERPGLWVGTEKIMALGLRIKNRVSYHGIALNVQNDLSIFKHIIPCGLAGYGVCSLKSLGIAARPMPEWRLELAQVLAGALSMELDFSSSNFSTFT